MADDAREAVDAMQADMAEHQRRFASGGVTAEKNQAMAAAAMEQLERRRAEMRLAPVASPPVQAPVEKKVERKEIDGKGYLLATNPTDDIATRPASPAEQWFLEHALPRIEMLLAKVESEIAGAPSWAMRTMSVLAFHAKAMDLKMAGHRELAEIAERRYMFELVELLEASSAKFGDWKKDAPKKLVTSVPG